MKIIYEIGIVRAAAFICIYVITSLLTMSILCWVKESRANSAPQQRKTGVLIRSEKSGAGKWLRFALVLGGFVPRWGGIKPVSQSLRVGHMTGCPVVPAGRSIVIFSLGAFLFMCPFLAEKVGKKSHSRRKWKPGAGRG